MTTTVTPRILEPKDPEETITLPFRFELGPNETISGQSVTCADPSGMVPSMLVGSAYLADDGVTVLQQIQAGTAGVDYHIRVSIDTSSGNRIVAAVRLPVRTK